MTVDIRKNIGTPLVILYEIEHINIVLAYFGIEKFKNGIGPVIVPINYEIELALRDKNIPFYSMTSYLERSSLKERTLLTSKMMGQLYTDPEFNFFSHNDIPLGKIVGYSLGEYILRILYYLDIFEYILDQFKDVHTIYFPESTIKVSSTAGQLAKFEIRAGTDTMAFLSQKRGIAFRKISCLSYITTEKKLLNLMRSCVRDVFIWSIKILNGIIYVFRTRGAMKIFVSDYWWHIDSFIEKMSGIEITMMERKEIRNIKKNTWKYKIRFNHPSDYSTYFIKDRVERKRQYYEQKWRELGECPNFSKQFVWYGIYFWDIVRPAYEHLITSFSEEVVETIETTERLFRKQHIQVVMLRASVSGQIHFATLGLVAHNMGIPAIELQHGLECSEEFSLSVRKNADILASYGSLIKKELEKVNGANVRVLSIGSPRFDQYRNETISEEVKNNLRGKLHIDGKRPVLLYIATDITLGQTYDTYSMVRLFKDIADAISRIEGLQIIVKIRPGPATENFFKKSIKEVFDEECCIAQYENLHALISISSIVASSFSTVILETMIAKKPLILVGLDANDRMLIESHFLPYERAQALRIARTKEELTQYVYTIITNPEEAKLLVCNASSFLKDNFCFDGRSAERMADFLGTVRT